MSNFDHKSQTDSLKRQCCEARSVSNLPTFRVSRGENPNKLRCGDVEEITDIYLNSYPFITRPDVAHGVLSRIADLTNFWIRHTYLSAYPAIHWDEASNRPSASLKLLIDLVKLLTEIWEENHEMLQLSAKKGGGEQ